jgi:hypothetical protein
LVARSLYNKSINQSTCYKEAYRQGKREVKTKYNSTKSSNQICKSNADARVKREKKKAVGGEQKKAART